MKELRKYFDGYTGKSYNVNVRTGIVRESATGDFPPDDIAGRVLKAVQGRVRAAKGQAARNQALRDLGLVRVRGALGGVYWE